MYRNAGYCCQESRRGFHGRRSVSNSRPGANRIRSTREAEKPWMRRRGSSMSISTSLPAKSQIVYPEDDGEPMSENTVQFRWIVTVKEGLERVFRDRPDVFVAGDLLWYPVEDQPEIRQAPDAMVVFGRPKRDRGSYMQWVEGGIAPQVVFEILSPGNRLKKMVK